MLSRTRLRFFILFLSAVIITPLLFRIPSHKYFMKKEMVVTRTNWSFDDVKPILLWNSFFQYFGDERHWLQECPELKSRCPLLKDRSKLSQAAAVLFHCSQDLNSIPMPTQRSPHQRYVFVCLESPESTSHFVSPFAGVAPEGFFNWTMTYRSPSNIVYKYGALISDASAAIPEQKLRSSLQNKTRTIVWAVSHCHTNSRREDIAAAIATHLSVHIIGDCVRSSECSRSGNDSNNCLKRLISSSYFFLAFENSDCEEYVTEKFWSRALLPSVPIVLRRSNYEHIAPPNSFIAVDDFDSIENLTDHLRLLISQPEEYRSYLKWQRDGYRFSTEENSLRGRCGLCSRLISESKSSASEYAKTTSVIPNEDASSKAEPLDTSFSPQLPSSSHPNRQLVLTSNSASVSSLSSVSSTSPSSWSSPASFSSLSSSSATWREWASAETCHGGTLAERLGLTPGSGLFLFAKRMAGV